MPVPKTRRELRLFKERQRGRDHFFRRSFVKIEHVQLEAIKLEQEQKQFRKGLKDTR